jgi:hypothetical protein
LSILNFDEVPLNPLPKINMDLRKWKWWFSDESQA